MATLVANVCAYVLSLFTARKLGPEGFGTLGALLALFYLFVIPSGALQTTVVRFASVAHAANSRAQLGGLLRRVIPGLLVLAMASMFVVGISARFLAQVSHVGSALSILALVALVWMTVLLAVNRGALQGSQQIAPLSANISLEAVARLALGVGFLALGYGVTGVLLAYCLATMFGLAVSWWSLPAPKAVAGAPQFREFIQFSGPVLAAYVAMAWMTNVDVLIVKHAVGGDMAGRYVLLSTIAKLLFFVSNALTDAMFALFLSSSQHARSRRLLFQTICIDTAICLPMIAGAFLLSHPVITLFFGPDYASVSDLLWRFLLANYLFTLIIIFSKDYLARNSFRFLSILVSGAASETVLLILFHRSLAQVLAVLIAVFLLTLLALSSISLTKLQAAKIVGRLGNGARGHESPQP